MNAVESIFYGNISLMNYIFVAIILFVIGACGLFMNRKSLITVLLSLEVMLLSVNISFVSFSVHLGDIGGQICTIFILTIAAAEAAIGLALIIVYYRAHKSIEIDEISKLSG